jgi:hypothetical protein
LTPTVGSPLHTQLVQSLRGFTQHGDDVANALSQGHVVLNFVNDVGMNRAARQAGIGWLDRAGLNAFAHGNNIFIEIGSNELPHIVHEADHVMRALAGTSNVSRGPAGSA